MKRRQRKRDKREKSDIHVKCSMGLTNLTCHQCMMVGAIGRRRSTTPRIAATLEFLTLPNYSLAKTIYNIQFLYI